VSAAAWVDAHGAVTGTARGQTTDGVCPFSFVRLIPRYGGLSSTPLRAYGIVESGRVFGENGGAWGSMVADLVSGCERHGGSWLRLPAFWGRMTGLARTAAGVAVLALCTAGGFPLAVSAGEDLGLAAQRRGMIEAIEDTVAETSMEIGKERLDPQVMAIMAKVPRHEFVPENVREYAYRNRPLPIGHGQTISQPYIVALMTDLLAIGPEDTVLEVGTGSAYQAAVLSELVKDIYTMEIIEALGRQAKARLERLGYDNVQTRVGDGYYGWEAHAPFDGIIVTAAASHVPPPLVQQLKPGGRMVIPVGSRFFTQYLMLVEKQPDGSVKTRQILPVRFVPLTGEH